MAGARALGLLRQRRGRSRSCGYHPPPLPNPAADNPTNADAARVAAIVVNWNGFADTCAAVDSLLAQDWPLLEVHVVDNDSAAGEADRLAARFGERIHLHRSPANLGFTGGHNLVLRPLLEAGEVRYVALLNNDAVAEPGWISALVAAAERDPQAGALASLMVFADRPDVVENAGVLMLRTGEAIPRGRGRRASRFARGADVLGACGAAVLLRAEALRQVGLFRDEFFLNFEDVDLCLRLTAAGWRCRYVPNAVVRHRLSRSIDKVRDEAFAVRSIRNMGFAYLANMPWPVLLLALPWLFVGWVVAPIACLLVLQPGYCRVLVRGRLRTLRDWPMLRAARQDLRALRRGSWWRVWRLHGSSAAAYARFVRDVVVLRRRQALR